MKKKFSVTFLITVEEDNNILSSYEASHEDDVFDMIMDVMYDVDDITMDSLLVKERT
jgi:hypothetical protein